MRAIGPLVAGIRGAENGSATVTLRGTQTAATLYLALEGGAQYSSNAQTLDANGSAVLYVDALVDVVVKDSKGNTIRQFTDGEDVKSVSFTGQNYTTLQEAASLPTTLETVLNRWLTSAGTLDFNVLLSGSAVTLQSALSRLAGVRNVKDSAYGAVGDGTTDDFAAIQACISAGEGVVYFPPGTYLISDELDVTVGTTLVGAGKDVTKIVANNGSNRVMLIQPSTGDEVCVSNMAMYHNTAATVPVLEWGAGGSTEQMRVVLSKCRFGDLSYELPTTAVVRFNEQPTLGWAVVEDCFININNFSGGGYAVYSNGVDTRISRTTFKRSSGSDNGEFSYFTGDESMVVEHCTFDDGGSTGTVYCIEFNTRGIAYSNRIVGSNAVLLTTTNTLALIREWGHQCFDENVYGFQVEPYRSTHLGSREGATDSLNATSTFDTLNYGNCVVSVSSDITLTFAAGNLPTGSMFHVFLDTDGTNRAVTFAGAVSGLPRSFMELETNDTYGFSFMYDGSTNNWVCIAFDAKAGGAADVVNITTGGAPTLSTHTALDIFTIDAANSDSTIVISLSAFNFVGQTKFVKITNNHAGNKTINFSGSLICEGGTVVVNAGTVSCVGFVFDGTNWSQFGVGADIT